jgi:hypothetical protein
MLHRAPESWTFGGAGEAQWREKLDISCQPYWARGRHPEARQHLADARDDDKGHLEDSGDQIKQARGVGGQNGVVEIRSVNGGS